MPSADIQGHGPKNTIASGVHGVTRTTKRRILEAIWPDEPFYVISHERSGTHFLINTVRRNTYVRHPLAKIAEWYGPYDDHSTRFDHIDALNARWPQLCKTAGMIKSHCDRPLFEARYRKAKVVYILRDPRDVMTSWFHYLNGDRSLDLVPPEAGDHHCESFSEFLRRPLSDWLRYSYSLHGDLANVAERWADHVSGWITAPDTLIVSFRELKGDYKAVVRKVARFIGLKPRFVQRPVGLRDARTVVPRKGIIGDWQTVFMPGDEAFLRSAVEKAGIEWHKVAGIE